MNKKTRSGATNYKRLKPFLLAVDACGGHFRFTSGEYMPLSIENLGYTDADGHPVYGMMHFYIQNGDLMRDPDMTFSVNDEAGTICPLTYQMDAMGIYQEVFRRGDDGRLLYIPSLLTDLDSFLRTWSTNIQDQGFNPAQAFQAPQTAYD